MRGILATMAFLALPAHAQDTADFGGTGCVLVPVTGQEWVAEARCRNVQTTGNAWSEGVMTVGDLVVGLTIQHGPGDVPDMFTILPPDGFVADPPVLVLNEHSRGVAVIRPWLGF